MRVRSTRRKSRSLEWALLMIQRFANIVRNEVGQTECVCAKDVDCVR